MVSTQEIAAHIRTREQQRYAAMVRGDFAAFADLAHPDLVYVHSNGVVDSLDSYLAKCHQGQYVYHHIDHPIDTVQVVGDLALVFGEMNAEITSSGVRKSLRNKVLAIWRRLDDQWRLFAYQPTPVK